MVLDFTVYWNQEGSQDISFFITGGEGYMESIAVDRLYRGMVLLTRSRVHDNQVEVSECKGNKASCKKR